MAIKVADIRSVFTDDELAKMDPDVVDRIKTGMEYALVQAGAKVVDPAEVKAKFAAVKAELLSVQVGSIGAIKPRTP